MRSPSDKQAIIKALEIRSAKHKEMRMRNLFLTMTMAVAFVASAAENPSAAFIQRTMKSLEASTAENPAHVRVLFYGQSITAQRWTEIVQKQLEERYPTVKFEFRNAAIGGYVSSVLIRTADHDLYPWYPDLLFFHVYGPMDKYEEIVKRVRERTSAEIVIWTSHLNIVSKDKPDQINTSHDDRAVLIRAVAPKYDCMLIDLREKWRKHLAANGIAVKDMLSDTVHLNPKGLDLYAKLIGERTGARAESWATTPTAAGTITTLAANAPDVTRGSDGRLTLRFTREPRAGGLRWQGSGGRQGDGAAGRQTDGRHERAVGDLTAERRSGEHLDAGHQQHRVRAAVGEGEMDSDLYARLDARRQEDPLQSARQRDRRRRQGVEHGTIRLPFAACGHRAIRLAELAGRWVTRRRRCQKVSR